MGINLTSSRKSKEIRMTGLQCGGKNGMRQGQVSRRGLVQKTVRGQSRLFILNHLKILEDFQ